MVEISSGDERDNAVKLLNGISVTVLGALTLGWMLAGQAATAQDATATPLKLDRKDAELDKIVPAGAQLEEMAGGYTWLEGPVWDEGSLFFSDVPANTIVRWTPGRGTASFMESSGYRGKEPYSGPEPGSNGMTLDPHGRLTVAGHASRTVFRFEPLDPTGIITTLADSYQGKKLNSPCDVVYRSDGSAYFTDPPYGLRTQSDEDPEKELKVNGIYRIPHALMQKPGTPPASGELQLLMSDLPRPNGIAFSPDEKYLYVSNSEPKKFWMRYTVNKDGTLSEPKLLYDDTDDPRTGNPGGMKVDVAGNIYSAAPGGVLIMTPEGKVLGTMLIPEKVSNVAWAGSESKTLYITASGRLYRVRLNITGAPLVKAKK
jgi:gluconolactonase